MNQDKIKLKTDPQYVQIFDPLGLFKDEDAKNPRVYKPLVQPKQESR